MSNRQITIKKEPSVSELARMLGLTREQVAISLREHGMIALKRGSIPLIKVILLASNFGYNRMTLSDDAIHIDREVKPSTPSLDDLLEQYSSRPQHSWEA